MDELYPYFAVLKTINALLPKLKKKKGTEKTLRHKIKAAKFFVKLKPYMVDVCGCM